MSLERVCDICGETDNRTWHFIKRYKLVRWFFCWDGQSEEEKDFCDECINKLKEMAKAK